MIATPTPSVEDAQRELVRIAARALRRGRRARPARLLPPARRPRRAARVAELVEAGELWPVEVEGWREPAYLHPAARAAARGVARGRSSARSTRWSGSASRAERLFGFRYRIEIYVPAPKRVHGYYVLPFLLGDRLVARVDLKADRAAGVLRVQAAHAEEHAPAGDGARRSPPSSPSMAGWLGLGGVAVEPRGDLAPALAAVA